jgi:hypothetical protein
MQETSLHAVLKSLYAQQGGQLEASVDGFLVDVLVDDLLIEIQTRNFSALKNKLAALIERHVIRLVHPIPQEKWIVNLPPKGEKPLTRRKSPKRGRLEHLFVELVSFPYLVTHPNFSLEVLLTREEEIRRMDGRGSWRRGGISIIDRRLVEVIKHHLLVSPEDFTDMIPSSLSQPFTIQQLASKLGITNRLASQMTYCLRSMNILTTVGTSRKPLVYAEKPSE